MKRYLRSNREQEKLNTIYRCYDDVMDYVNQCYENDRHVSESAIDRIKRDYMVGAIESDLMTEEEFNQMYDDYDSGFDPNVFA